MKRTNGRSLIIRGGRTPFETKLIETGEATCEQYGHALKKSFDEWEPLIHALQEITKRTLPQDLIRYYNRAHRLELTILYRIEAVDREIDCDLCNAAAISSLVEKIIPIEICREYEILPLKQTDKSLIIGMVSPHADSALDQINIILHPRNIIYQRRVISQEDFAQLFDDLIDFEIDKANEPNVDRGDDSNFLLKYEILKSSDSEPTLDLLLANNPVPIAQLVDRILAISIEREATEISVEPQSNYLNIRLRVDGVLQEIHPKLPASLANPLTNRLKLIAELDITKRQIPQTGKLIRLFQGRRVNFQVRTFPVDSGENVVVKILDNARPRRSLLRMKNYPTSQLNLERLCDRTSGLVLIVGEANSDISTTLYTLLEQYSKLGRKVFSIENPIELPLSHLAISQVEVNSERGVAYTLKSIQQQEPEVIMVSEIPSPEIARMLFALAPRNAILTSLQDNHSINALSQLLSMDISPVALSKNLNAVIYQQVLRRICSQCRIASYPSPKELESCGLLPSKVVGNFYKARVVDRKVTSGQQQICPHCHGVGYKGSIAIFETMTITETLRTAISKRVPSSTVRQMAIEGGMKTLLEYSHELVKLGYTTIEEVVRLIASNSLLEEEKKIKLTVASPPLSVPANPPLVTPPPVVSPPVAPPNKETLMGIIAALDLFDFADRQFQAQTQREEAILEGYEHLRKHLSQVLQKAGVTCMETIGQPFDPKRHEVVMTNPSLLHPANTVIAEIKRGYMSGDRVLRHAQVEVAVPNIPK